MTTGSSSFYYLFDGLGSVVGLVDATGSKVADYAYSPYGETRTATGTQAATNPWRYIASYQDTSGLYKLGHRYYDPTLGRFTQPDPSGQEDNNYLYAGGDCINRVDPSGLFSWSSLFEWDGRDHFSFFVGCAAGAAFVVLKTAVIFALLAIYTGPLSAAAWGAIIGGGCLITGFGSLILDRHFR